MKKPSVYFSSLRDDSDTPLEKIDKLLTKLKLDKFIAKNDAVAVKIHIGEEGNVRYIRPTYVRKIVDRIKKAGGKPFVTDTTSLYPGPRFNGVDNLRTAAKNGFTAESMGAPIIIADGVGGYNGVYIGARSSGSGGSEGFLEEVHVARAIADCDKMVVASHLKLHEFAGFGGAIKNLGMGCVTKETKAACHQVNRPYYNSKKCEGCFECIDKCEWDCIKKKGKKIQFDRKNCRGCLACYFGCDHSAWKLPKKIMEKLQPALAESALGVTTLVGAENIIYLNLMIDIVEFCDCAPLAGVPVVPDIGYLASEDGVAVDAACVELMDQEVRSEKRKLKAWKYEKQRNQIDIADGIKLGRGEYTLKRL